MQSCALSCACLPRTTTARSNPNPNPNANPNPNPNPNRDPNPHLSPIQDDSRALAGALRTGWWAGRARAKRESAAAAAEWVRARRFKLLLNDLPYVSPISALYLPHVSAGSSCF